MPWKSAFRNGWYMKNGERVEFQMQNEHGIQKGHRAIPNFVITDLHNEYDAHCKKITRIRKFN